MRHIVIFLLIANSPIFAQSFSKLTTKGGISYKDVSVKEVLPDSIKIFHSEGIANVSLEDLSEDLRKQFNYNPVAAEVFKTEQTKKRQQAAALYAEKQKLEKRFVRWTTELARKKQAALYGPPQIYQDGGSTAQANKFSEEAKDIIFIFEIRFKHLRKIISQMDADGVSVEETQYIIDSVYDEKVFIGMSRDLVILAWGPASDVNTTITSSGKSEQWVYRKGDYDSQYVHIAEDGKVSSISD